jgi:TetR/AcrR family transcriptional regulator, tetracycline repressor protein
VRTARQIVRVIGAEKLTVRRLSDDLGVALGATYHHVPDRRALMRLIARDIFREVELPSIDQGNWTDHVHVAITNFARLLGEHPGMAAEIARDQAFMNPVELATFLRERLSTAGFDAGRTDVVMASLFFYVGGFALATPNHGVDTDAARDLALEYFEAGLRLLLAGVAVELNTVR